jgi:GNAT superfamily N-acetyltransferase
MRMPIELHLPAEPTDDHYEMIMKPLRAFNVAVAGPLNYAVYAIVLRDAETGEESGGLYGHFYYDWLFVELLAVPEPLRGQNLGTRLMDAAEDEARRRGCVGVWLDTFSFQAPAFYAARGYEVFGAIDDYPVGKRRMFLRKRLGRDRTL